MKLNGILGGMILGLVVTM